MVERERYELLGHLRPRLLREQRSQALAGMPTAHHAIVGPPSGPKLRQPYRAPKNAPVVAYHCGHIVRRKPTPNPSGPPARTKQNFKEHWNEHKWERGRGLELAQRLEQPAESAALGAPQLATTAPGMARLAPRWRSTL